MIGLYRDPHGQNIIDPYKSDETEAGKTLTTLQSKVTLLERRLTELQVCFVSKWLRVNVGPSVIQLKLEAETQVSTLLGSPLLYYTGPSEKRTTSLQRTDHLPLIDFTIELLHFERPRSGDLSTSYNGH